MILRVLKLDRVDHHHWGDDEKAHTLSEGGRVGYDEDGR